MLSGEGYDTLSTFTEMPLGELFAWIGARNRVVKQHGR